MRRSVRQLSWALVLSLPFVAFQPCAAEQNSQPIVDVRFDAPYRQVESSFGDEWAPTWGRDDVLYTANDDGTSFGGVPENAIAFGKLEGRDPYTLKATTTNAMRDYHEARQFGPESARWKTLDTYKVNGVVYRFAPCGSDSDRAMYSCLTTSTDDGKTWTPIGSSGLAKPLFRNPKFSAPSFIGYRKDVEFLLGDNAGEYVYATSYFGVVGGEDTYVVGRVRKEKLPQGNATDWTFQRSDDFSWKSSPDEALQAPPMANSVGLEEGIGPDNANWKATNSYGVDGVLYMFITRCHYPWVSGDPKLRHVFRDSSVIQSIDNGRTWTRSAEENFTHPMFPGKRFGAPYFVWYGKDGAASVDNADKYVYAVSNNGHWENGDDYVLGRVLRSKLPHLAAADWSFYKAGNGMEDGSWTSILAEAKPVLSNPDRSGMTGMTYIEGLHRYVMVVWHYHQDNFKQAFRDKDLRTVLEFFEAPKPWGPWNTVKTFDTGRLGWFTPIIGQRFQTLADASAAKVFLYATGFYSGPEGGASVGLYKLNYMPMTLSTKPLPHNNPTFVGGR